MNRISSAGSNNAEVISLSAYLREIGGNRILTRSEERLLFDRMARGDRRAHHELITANLKFVVSVCHQFRNQGLPMTDLISEGNLGLIRAAQCFDLSHSCRFITYAVWWIRQRILRALAEQSRFLNIPVAKAAAMRKIAAAEKVLSQRKARPASADEVAEYLSLREGDVLDLMQLLQVGQYSLALQNPGFSEGDESSVDFLEGATEENPEQGVQRDNLRQEVRDALESLRGVEREVLRMHFGLGPARAFSLEEISMRLGLTRSKVRKIRDDAMNRLRHPERRLRFRELI